MAKKGTLHERYISEEDRKRNRKQSTLMMCIIGGLFASYLLGYCFTITDGTSMSILDALSKVEENVSAFKIFYAPAAPAVKGWLLGIVAAAFIYFVLSVDNERHATTNMEKSAGTGGFMTKNMLAKYNTQNFKPDPKPIADYDKQNPKGKPWSEIEGWYSQNMINSQHFTRPVNSRMLIGNNNVLVVGGAGTGKSRFVIKPNMLQMNSSYIVTDPSGELIASLGNLLAKNGYRIKIFNISNKRYSNTYNPIRYVKKEEDVNTLITCLIDNTTKGEGGGDNQFFVDAEKLLYSACIFYLIDFCRDESRKNFAGVMDLIISSNVDEANANAKSPLDKVFDKLPKSSLASKYYRSFKQAAGKTLKSIIISCVTRLQPFLIPQVINLTKTDELELEKLGNERTALFIITPQADRTYSFLASILYSQLFMTLYDVAEKRKATEGDERLPVPVRCLMDEFANIGTVPAFDEKLATMRKYNISATVVLQNLSQIEAMYQDKWKTIVGNCSTIIFLGSPEKENLEYFSEMLGKETIRTKSTSSSNGGKGGSNSSYQYTSREVMTPDEIGVMPPDECIVFTQNLRPVRDKKYKLEDHPYFEQTGDKSPDNNFSYMEISAFDNSNSCKFESILVARSEIKKYRAGNTGKMEAASECKVCKGEDPDKVINDRFYSEEEKESIIKRCTMECVRQLALKGDEDDITVETGYIPTRFMPDIHAEVCKKAKVDNVILFTNIRKTKDAFLCYTGEDSEDVISGEFVLKDKKTGEPLKKQLESGGYIFSVMKKNKQAYAESLTAA